jgi:hypothetical protein
MTFDEMPDEIDDSEDVLQEEQEADDVPEFDDADEVDDY